MFRPGLILGLFLVAVPILAAGRIQVLQKRIQKDRHDILYFMTRIKDAQTRLKADKAKAAKAGEDGPDGKWTSRAAKEQGSIEKDRASQAKAQNDLAQAQEELNRLLSK